MIIKYTQFLPIIIFSNSKFMGSAGSECHGIIGIAIDFPLWFIFYVIFHEFVHYISHFLPITFKLRYNICMWNERIADKFINLLPLFYRTKTVFNYKKCLLWLHYLRRIEKRDCNKNEVGL